jgi:pimeloyl-ACP methyl ester carboxylesterase
MTPTPPPKPTLIFVPGGWHVPAHYQPTTALLTARGFKTICVHNPSSRNDPPWPQHYSYDTAAVAAHILAETALDNDVLVIMHSYGGFPGGAACEGLLKSERAKGGQKGGVVGVVYVSAFALDADVSLADLGDRVGPWPWIQPDVSPAVIFSLPFALLFF